MQTANYMMNKQVNKYLANDILNASPEQVIMKVFGFAIQSCNKHDISKTNEALQVLINALNFDHPEAKEISIGFFRIYRYCQDQMRKQNFEIVHKTLSELKESWETALAKR
ncbi:MAG: flagellar protein FliS [Melioribacteraceae bacterium]